MSTTPVVNLSHWSYNGFDFNAVGIIVRSPVGPGQLPGLRGSDIPNAGIPGGLMTPKVHDIRSVTLDLWLPASWPKTLGWPGIDPMLDILGKLFGDTSSHDLTYYGATDGSPRIAQAYVASWAPVDQDVGGVLYIGTVTFTMVEPYFYGAKTDTIYGFASAQSILIQNPGMVATRRIQLYFTGACTNPAIVNTTNGLTLALTASVAGSGGSLEVDCYTWSVYNGGVWAIGDLAHSGDAAFMRFDPGPNQLQVTASAYGGNFEVVFRPGVPLMTNITVQDPQYVWGIFPTGIGTATLTFTIPGSAEAGDFAMIFLPLGVNSGTVPSDWVDITHGDQLLFTKTLDSTDPNSTVSFTGLLYSGAQSPTGLMVGYRFVNTVVGAAEVANQNIPSLTALPIDALQANAMQVCFWAASSSPSTGATLAAPAGMIADAAAGGSAGNSGLATLEAHLQLTEVGPTSPQTAISNLTVAYETVNVLLYALGQGSTAYAPLVAPALQSVNLTQAQGLEVQVFEGFSQQQLDVLQRASGVGLQWVLDGPGSGTFQLNINDPKATRANLQIGNVVKIAVDGTIRGAFIIEEPSTIYLDATDSGNEIATITGRTLECILQQAVTHPPYWGTPYWEPSVVTTTYTQVTAASILIAELELAQARMAGNAYAAIPQLTWDFTATEDSRGNTWDDVQTLTIPIGTDLLSLAQTFAALAFDFYIDHEFVLHAYQYRGYDRSQQVIFRKGRHLTASGQTTTPAQVVVPQHLTGLTTRTLITSNGILILEVANSEQEDQVGIGIREAIMAYDYSADPGSCQIAGLAALQEAAAQTDPLVLPVAHGYQLGDFAPFYHYDIGDTITEDIPILYPTRSGRIVSLTVAQQANPTTGGSSGTGAGATAEVGGSGYDVALEIDARHYEALERVVAQLQVGGLSIGQSALAAVATGAS